MTEPQITNFHGIKIEGFKGASTKKRTKGMKLMEFSPLLYTQYILTMVYLK